MHQHPGEDAVGRTRQPVPEQVVRQGDLCIHLAGHTVTRNGQPIELSERLFRLLVYFVQHPNIVVTRRQLMEQLRDGEKTLGDERDMTMYIHWLRETLEDDPTHPHHIHTCRGIGYRFTP